MRCPQCRDEYEAGVTRCGDCHVPLVSSHGPAPPQFTLLGTFHPLAAGILAPLLAQRRIAHEQLAVDVNAVEVLVDRDHRDELRAELVANWNGLIGGLPTAEKYELLSGSTTGLPGWHDAPDGSWIDREGRFKVAATVEEREQDAHRILGPSLLTIGLVIVLFGWYAGGGSRELAVLVGIVLVIAGIFSQR